jgi:hypothetical protein
VIPFRSPFARPADPTPGDELDDDAIEDGGA